MTNMRGNPDKLLKMIQEEEKTQSRGHLKIFFGYAAGVGKTYAMLKAAHAAKRRGINVVIGYVEPHSRPETARLMHGLECLPRLEIAHKDITVHEFDLDETLRRAPQLVLVDELAHTNAPGARHAKRYQDIEELLKAGIHIYTTVNVQHLESLNDIVASITGVMVKERIPDQFFDQADQVELVDIEPEELIERFEEGNVYQKKQVQKALGNFFTNENLIALREIALRRCADRVNKMAEKTRMMQGSTYFTGEHILVCLSSSPTAPKIIRTASRMAAAFRADFTALFVETPDFQVMEEDNKARLRSNIRLAEQLGAVIETVYGDDIAQQIAEFSRLSGVSKIVFGRANAKRKHWFGKQSLIEKLTVAAPNLDIYIIPDKETPQYTARSLKQPIFTFVWQDALKSVIMLMVATCVGFGFYNLKFSEANIITVYILSVLITAVVTSQRIYSIISSIISVLIFNYFFTVPRFTFQVHDKGYPITFIIMFLAAFITSTLAVKIKQHAKQAAETAYRTKLLLETNQMLQSKKEKSGIIDGTAKQLRRLLSRDIIFYAAQQDHLEAPAVFALEDSDTNTAYSSEKEQAVAAWVFKNNKRAGATTETLGSAQCLYLAVRSNERVYGVVGVAIETKRLDAFENSIMLSILGECALALENQRIFQEREEAAVQMKNEQLRANLLRAISHDLRTPLTSISGNADILLRHENSMSKEKRMKLYNDVYDDSLWLINLVENLLSVTRIEEGSMHIQMVAELMDEVIEEAMKHINRDSIHHVIHVERSEEFIMAKMDARLIVQVLINIIDNAIKYTQKQSQIVIQTRKEDGYVIVDIADNGKGIDNEAKSKVFDMFYTVGNKIGDSRRSLGLGLALCKSIITLHGGEISVRDNIPKGTIFRFTLPAKEVHLHD